MHAAQDQHPSPFDTQRAYRILLCDPVGLLPVDDAVAAAHRVAEHVAACGARFHHGPLSAALPPGIHFSYQPDLSRAQDLLAQCSNGQFDGLIAAATPIPEGCRFVEGGVRIGAGTGNMASRSWGGGDGGGAAPLMNTPGFNAVATAQMAIRAVLRARPGLPVADLHEAVMAERFDTGEHLSAYATTGLPGETLAVLGFGNIGRRVAALGAAFGMRVVVFARHHWRPWIESLGYAYAATPEAAARGAAVLSVHLGLGADGANAGLVGDAVLTALTRSAVLVNYDRGELVDIEALRAALSNGQVERVMVDADVFLREGAAHGPLTPYVALARKFPDRLELLPHAAADTDHASRVAGACQAVDQILLALRERRVVNGRGALPAGYKPAGLATPVGVGAFNANHLVALRANPAPLSALHADAERLLELLDVLRAPAEPALAVVLAGVQAANRLCAGLTGNGMSGVVDSASLASERLP